jgi:hypothetical protein
MSLPLPLREGAEGGGAGASRTPSPNPLPQGEWETFTPSPPLMPTPTANPPRTPNSAPSPTPTSNAAPGLTDAELRMLLIDCLRLWGVEGRISVNEGAIEIATPSATLRVQRAPRDMLPVRWLLHRSASRPPRVAPSIVALLTALRNALGGEGGNRIRIGGSA